MNNCLKFEARADFRCWLEKHCRSGEGVWLVFGKPGGPITLKASEALEEALCFGWIDGQMKKIDDQSYIKYFSERRKDSKWSAKNKSLAEKLEKQGIMTDYGREKIEQAKQNGQWTAGIKNEITEEQVAFLGEILNSNEQAFQNFQAMSPSVKRTYARAYFDAKTEKGKASRLAWMVDRLEKNLKPM